MAGNHYVNFPRVCKHFTSHGGKRWDVKKLCGPKVMGGHEDPERNDSNCCYKHPAGCERHKNHPTVNGKPFKLSEHKAGLVKAGLAGFRQELQNDGIAGRPPPGVPKEINGVKIYPARQRDDKQAAIMIAAVPRRRGGAPKKWLVRLHDATAKWAVPAARQFTSSGNDNCC